MLQGRTKLIMCQEGQANGSVNPLSKKNNAEGLPAWAGMQADIADSISESPERSLSTWRGH